MTRKENGFNEGDSVWWFYEPRGGYGYRIKVPAFVQRICAKKVSIEAQKKDGTFKTVRVNPENLWPRS